MWKYWSIWAQSRIAAVQHSILDHPRPKGFAPVTAVSPKRTQGPRREFAIADLHHAGRELTVCGTKLAFAAAAPMSAMYEQGRANDRPSPLAISCQALQQILREYRHQ